MNEESLFLAAAEQPDAAAREALLAAACAGDPDLRERVERLLRAADRSAGILERAPDAAGAAPAGVGSPLEPRRLFAGRYKLRERLGEGGMGEVWVADQLEPVRRRVALKVVRAGQDTARMLARFEQERQALALMDHPHIAKVLDAGVDEAGRPYFVMELIKGVSITAYCDAAKLTPRQRLELFVPVCQAVQHAHQKGVIHRDLKPSNILVGLYDDRAVPKVIDFGVAKASGPRLSDRSIYTEVGSLVGTLEYMSPEQAEPNNLDIDTRTDVYALGAVLHELLTGTVPFSRRQLHAAGFVEMLRIIKEVEPTVPSTKLSGSGTLAHAAAARQTEPRKLVALLRGDLDWIILKCLEKSRARRYETASALAADLGRYLGNEPVSAGPPGAGYRLRKFVRRNRGPVAAAAIAILLLAGGSVGTTVGLVRAERAQRAEAERAEGERQAKRAAERRLVQVEKAVEVLAAIFGDLDPQAEEKENRPLRALLGDRLDQAAADLAGDDLGDPLLVARLRDRLARTYLGLGRPADAERLFARAVAARREHLGPDDPLTLRSLAGQAKACHLAGKPPEAIRLYEQVRDAQTRMLGPDDLDTLVTLSDLAAVYRLTGDAHQAVELLERVRDGRAKRLGEEDDAYLDGLSNLAQAYTSARRHPEAVALSERVLAALVKKHGDDHPLSLAALNALGRAYHGGRRMRDALDLFERAKNATVPKLGPFHPQTLAILHNLTLLYRAFRKTSDAIALGEVVLKRRLLVQGDRHPATLDTCYVLALAFQDDGQLAKALPLFERAAAGLERQEFKQVNAGTMLAALCDCQEKLGQYDRAEPWRRKCLAVRRATAGPDSAVYGEDLRDLGANLLKQGRPAEAVPYLREALPLLDKDPAEPLRAAQARTWLGAALVGARKFDEAKPILLDAYQRAKAAAVDPAPHHYGRTPAELLAEALDGLVRLHEAWGKKDEADKWRTELEAAKANPPGQDR